MLVEIDNQEVSSFLHGSPYSWTSQELAQRFGMRPISMDTILDILYSMGEVEILGEDQNGESLYG